MHPSKSLRTLLYSIWYAVKLLRFSSEPSLRARVGAKVTLVGADGMLGCAASRASHGAHRTRRDKTHARPSGTKALTATEAGRTTPSAPRFQRPARCLSVSSGRVYRVRGARPRDKTCARAWPSPAPAGKDAAEACVLGHARIGHRPDLPVADELLKLRVQPVGAAAQAQTRRRLQRPRGVGGTATARPRRRQHHRHNAHEHACVSPRALSRRHRAAPPRGGLVASRASALGAAMMMHYGRASALGAAMMMGFVDGGCKESPCSAKVAWPSSSRSSSPQGRLPWGNATSCGATRDARRRARQMPARASTSSW
jgi:hypothetical protein